ncbi:MAG: 3-hydroxyacyl-CoA dehydrogenase, partial [Pseudomonadota bacterium]
LGDAYPESAAKADTVLFKLFELGRLGRKAKAGYYAYDDKGKRQGIWPGLRETWPPAADQPDVQDVKHRLILAQVLEAVRALEEGVLTDVREGDVGAILGWGFMPWSGGPFSWLDRIGAAAAVDLCQALSQRHGPRFAPPALLIDMAKSGATFYGGPPAEKAA